jgi:ATP-dependent RNA helicase DHX8/PRP22
MSSSSDKKDIRRLQKLELVNRVTQELVNHTSITDSLLAEYIISLHKSSNGSYSLFKEKLTGIDAGFPDTFIASLDRLITTLSPSSSGKKRKRLLEETGGVVPREEGSSRNVDLFPGLAIKDDDALIQAFREEDAVDETMKELEEMEGLAHGAPEGTKQR